MAAASLLSLMVPIGTDLLTTGIGTTNYKLTLPPAFPRLFARARCNTTSFSPTLDPNALVPWFLFFDYRRDSFFVLFLVSFSLFIGIGVCSRGMGREEDGDGDGDGEGEDEEASDDFGLRLTQPNSTHSVFTREKNSMFLPLFFIFLLFTITRYSLSTIRYFLLFFKFAFFSHSRSQSQSQSHSHSYSHLRFRSALFFFYFYIPHS